MAEDAAGRATPVSALPTTAQVRDTYDSIAESYAPARREPWPEVLSFVHALPPGARVLDVGCGHGRHLAAIAARGYRVTGLDFSRKLIAIGARDARIQDWRQRARWVVGEATALPIRSTSFDACTCVAVLHHLPTHEARLTVLREIRRALVDGGVVLVSVWLLEQARFRELIEAGHLAAPRGRGDVNVPWRLPDGSTVPRFYHLFGPRELEALILESGLQKQTSFSRMGNDFAVASRG